MSLLCRSEAQTARNLPDASSYNWKGGLQLKSQAMQSDCSVRHSVLIRQLLSYWFSSTDNCLSCDSPHTWHGALLWWKGLRSPSTQMPALCIWYVTPPACKFSITSISQAWFPPNPRSCLPAKYYSARIMHISNFHVSLILLSFTQTQLAVAQNTINGLVSILSL